VSTADRYREPTCPENRTSERSRQLAVASPADDTAGLPDLTGDQAGRLLDAVIGVASDLSLPDVLRRIVDSAARLAGARYGALGVLDEGGGELSEFIVTGLDAEAQRRIGDHPRGKGVLGLLIAQPEPVRLPDIRLHPDSYGFPPHHPPMRSFLGVPVRVSGAVFGNLYLAEKVDAREFTSGDEQVVVALAAAAGVAVEKARLYRDSRRREEWLEAANAITTALLAERGPDEVIDRIARQARAVTGGDMAAVALPARDGEGWVVKAAVGTDAPRATRRRIDGTHPAVAEALKRPETVCRADPEVAAALLDHRAPATLIVPVALGSDPLALLVVVGSGPFHEVDRSAATAFGNQAALALEVARAQDDQSRLALFEERDRIARDLHDSVIQRLFGTGLRMQGLRELVEQPSIDRQLGEFVEDLDTTIRDIRRTIFDLRDTPEPGPVSLRSQLLQTIRDAARNLHVDPRVTFTGPLDTKVPDEVRDDVRATLREALSNAARHAEAGQVYVEVTVTEPEPDTWLLELSVRDDGQGIRPGSRAGGGLANMGDRAARWGGRCVVEPNTEGGTHVYWSVPLPVEPDAQADDPMEVT
jgi:signal transduction histidine kinase